MPPTYGFIMQEDQPDWRNIYQGLFMPNYSFDHKYRWKFYFAIDGQFPSDEDLKTIKVLLFPGSAQAVYDPDSKFFPKVADFVRKIMYQPEY